MKQKEDLLDIYDENNEPTNQVATRTEAHKKGLWHRTGHVWIYNNNGEILLQQRAKEKKIYPNMWSTSVGGHIDAGESIETGLVSEVREEVGLIISTNDLIPFKMIEMLNTPTDKEFSYGYFLENNQGINSFKVDKSEVQKVKFFKPNELREKLKTNKNDFTTVENYWEEVIQKIEEITS